MTQAAANAKAVSWSRPAVDEHSWLIVLLLTMHMRVDQPDMLPTIDVSNVSFVWLTGLEGHSRGKLNSK